MCLARTGIRGQECPRYKGSISSAALE